MAFCSACGVVNLLDTDICPRCRRCFDCCSCYEEAQAEAAAEAELDLYGDVDEHEEAELAAIADPEDADKWDEENE